MEKEVTGMAPTPEQMNRIRATKIAQSEAENGAGKGAETSVTVKAPYLPLKVEVVNIVRGVHWQYQKRILDHVECMVQSDRQWEVVRRVIMGIQTEQVETTAALIGQRITKEFMVGNE